MKDIAIVCVVLLAGGLAFAGEVKSVRTESVGKVAVVCDSPAGWTFTTKLAKDALGREVLTLTLDSAEKALPPDFHVQFDTPSDAVRCLWRPEAGWGGYGLWLFSSNLSHLSEWEPLYALVDTSDFNRFTIAAEEVKYALTMKTRLVEETGKVAWDIRYFENREAQKAPCGRLAAGNVDHNLKDPVASPAQNYEPCTHYETSLLLDTRRVHFSESVKGGSDWVFAKRGIEPLAAPPAAYKAWYETWYGFHRTYTAELLEPEYERAQTLGMKCVIIDSGWFQDNADRIYHQAGDWNVSKKKFPKGMAEHIAKIHARDMKVIIWFATPFVGFKTEAFKTTFRDKLLFIERGIDTGVLDPRFPEVREYIASTLEKYMKEWDVDGFKLDFLNNLFTWQGDPALADDFKGRDYRNVGDATMALYTDVIRRLKAIKPDVLIEIRPSYQSPELQRFGNMMRVADCPASLVANRCGIAALKLMCPKAAVHSDMIMWDPLSTPETAARHILDAAFGAVQYSTRLDDDHSTPAIRAMMKHWIAFYDAHEETLQRGTFKPHAPFANYPVLESETAKERIIAVYEPGRVVDLGLADKPVYLLNATGEDRVTLRLPAMPVRFEAFDTYGKPAMVDRSAAGVADIKMPISGYLSFHWK